MDEDHVAAGEFLAARHLVLDELAVMRDELEVEILHPTAGAALAGGRLLDVAEPLAEGEVGSLDGVLQERPVDLVRDRIDEGGVAFELRQAKRRAKSPDHRVHEVGDDVLGVVEFDAGKKAGVAGNIGDDETGGFWFRKHRNCPVTSAADSWPHVQIVARFRNTAENKLWFQSGVAPPSRGRISLRGFSSFQFFLPNPPSRLRATARQGGGGRSLNASRVVPLWGAHRTPAAAFLASVPHRIHGQAGRRLRSHSPASATRVFGQPQPPEGAAAKPFPEEAQDDIGVVGRADRVDHQRGCRPTYPENRPLRGLGDRLSPAGGLRAPGDRLRGDHQAPHPRSAQTTPRERAP